MKEFLGYIAGAEGKLTHPDKETEYFAALDKASDRVLVQGSRSRPGHAADELERHTAEHSNGCEDCKQSAPPPKKSQFSWKSGWKSLVSDEIWSELGS